MGKVRIILMCIVLVASFSFLHSCSSDITVCECLKDDGSHKDECDELGRSMTEEELSREMNACN